MAGPCEEPRGRVLLAVGSVQTWTAEADVFGDDDVAGLKAITAPKRRNQFVAGRRLARHLLCEWAPGKEAGDWDIATDGVGRPWAVGRGANTDCLHLSISHSGDRVACALADHALGIDIEALPPRRSRDLDGLMHGIGSPAEIDAWNATAPAERSIWFHRLWVVKEAWLKSRGEGVTPGRLQQLCVRSAAPADEWIVWCRTTPEDVMACHARAVALRSLAGLDPQLESWWAVDDLAGARDGDR